MLKNKKFAKYAIAFSILGILFNFFYSGLQNDQINIIQASSAWTNIATNLPMTVGSFVCIILYFIWGTLFLKFGVKKVLIPCILGCAVGCVGIAAANGVYTISGVELASAAAGDSAVVGTYALFAASLFLIRCLCSCFQMAGFMFVANWFIKYRGRIMGIITLGSPLFSVVGTSGMTSLIATAWNGDYRPFYIIVCVLLIIMAILVAVLLKDTPEEVGLYPDGADHAPISEAEVEEDHLTVTQVLSQPKAWFLIISFGVFQYIINACMSSMVVWFSYLCTTNADAVAAGPLAGAYANIGAMTLFVSQASKWLSVGAILGIPMSYVFGWLDDKIGSIKTSFILALTCMLPVIGLMAQASAVASTGSCNVAMLIVWGFGVACMTGGVPTMHPCVTSYAYGRREYQSANRVIMTIQAIPMAFSVTISQYFINAGLGVQYWIALIIAIVVGMIALIPLLKVQDANAADRA